LLTQPARQISVLIPARNEEASIAACVEAVLASGGVELEVIVLDDHSDDATAEIVRELAWKDRRLRLEAAPPLPPGWCGKQHACFALAKLARFPVLSFIDADVRLAPDALERMAAFLRESKAGLVSGFPRQQTGSFLEKLLVPLINWVLLSYLPIGAMRRSRWAAFGAGCGQWFMTTREAYDRAGGHESIKGSMHDGITLPRAYRRAGIDTDLCDATDLATCRMYRSSVAVWNGLAKNAHEGMGSVASIVPWTFLLLSGSLAIPSRWHAAWRFGDSRLGAVMHPLGVLLLIAIQWYALFRRVIGRPIGWKGRQSPGPPATGALDHTSNSSAIA
jgi:glycosyltransferase involved in cell wall biosynthesis